MSTAESDVMITLRSRPDEAGESMTFVIPYKSAELSDFIKDAVSEEIEGEEDSGGINEIDVPRVSGRCLGKVVDFLNHYSEQPMKEVPTPLGGATFNEVSDPRG
mgnify:CR=1 FL=1